jgi:ribose transport system ATP-binding protein/rhamnose transport system ATP-binding protein
MPARLQVREVSKTFPGVQALERVSLDVMPGEIHALLGENGAGKSTLGKIVAGVYARDEGSLALDGVSLRDIDETEAGRLGIGIVHQEGSLVRTLSIADNIFAGRQPTRSFGRVDVRTMVARSRTLLEQLGVDLDPREKVAALSSAQAQVVEIAKALSQDLRLLILDEPTAALTLTESERLFEAVRRLKANGLSIIYVSHRLAEIFKVCDRVSVLKDGRLSGTREVAATSTEELIRLMVGRDIVLSRQAGERAHGPTILEVERLSAEPFVRDVSFSVRAGEIVCLAGLVGSGRSETCESIFGARPTSGGDIRVRGAAVRFRDPREAIAAGLGMAPEDRKDAGLFLTMDVASNISVSVMERVSESGWISAAKSEALARRFVEELRIVTPSVRTPVGDLSGGNQQKVMLAKWLALNPEVLIVDEPTRGVDVGARAEIYRILRSLAAKGIALLVVSSDLPEVLALADRIVVMADGRTVGELDGATADEEAVLRLATQYTKVSMASNSVSPEPAT